MTTQNKDKDRKPLDYSEYSKSERPVASRSTGSDDKPGASEMPPPPPPMDSD